MAEQKGGKQNIRNKEKYERSGREVRKPWKTRVKQEGGRMCSSLSGSDWLVSASRCHLHRLLQGGGGWKKEEEEVVVVA